MSDVTIGALTLILKADESQLRATLERYRALGAQGLNVKVTADSAAAQAGLKGVTDAANAAGAAGKSAGAAIGQGNKEAIQTAGNYARTISLNMQLEAQRASEYRAGISLNSRIASDATRQQSALESEAARSYRASMSLNLGLAAQRAAADKAAAVQSASAAQQSASAFTAGAERTKQALDGIRLAYAQTRAAFDKNDGEARSWQEKRNAAVAYQQSVNTISASLITLRNSGEATTVQLKQLADIEARLAREQNTLAGGINRIGISGNFQNAIGGAQQLSMFMPGLIGQSLGAASAFQQIASTSGVMGVALGAAGLAVFALGKTMMTTQEAFSSFQQGLQGISSIDTSLSGKDMQDLAGSFQKLSTELPITTEQLTNMARGAVQMGITGKDAILEFTNSIALLAVATRDNNKSLGDTGQLANELGVFLNETGSTARTYTTDLKGVVATLAAVDKVTPGTIQSTLSLARYMASGSVVLNLNKESIIGLSGALSGLGARSEAGGSAVIRVLMAMNRAAGGTKDQLAGLEGVAGITKDELANVFQGTVTVKAKAFADVMGVSAEQFKILVRTSPAQAFQLLAEGLARAHASGVDMTAAMDAMGIKNVRDIRLIDQLTVGHANLKIALDASSQGSKNQADLLDRVNKATDNNIDKTTEMTNAWDAFKVSLGAAGAPWATNAIKNLTDIADAAKRTIDVLSGVNVDAKSWADRQGLDITKLSPQDQQKAQIDIVQMQGLVGKTDTASINTYRAYLEELNTLREKIQGSAASVVSGTAAGAGGLLGAVAPRILNEFGVSGSNYHHDGFSNPNAKHYGVDLGAARGTPIYAPFTGNMTARRDAKNGNIFELTDAEGSKLVGLHLDAFSTEIKAALMAGGGKALVKKGAQIGTVGNTGDYAGAAPHLHAEGVFANGTKVDFRTIAYQGIGDTDRTAVALKAGGQAIQASKKFSPTVSGDTGPDEATLRRTGQALYDAYQGGDHSTGIIKAMNAFKKAHKEMWQSIGADAKKGKDDLTPITAAQILEAQRLEAALKKAQDAHNPGAIDAATSALTRYTQASFSNARAVQSVNAAQGKDKAAGAYIASASDLKKYGSDALQLIKAQELASKSGDDARIASSDATLAAFTKDSNARASVVQVEEKAYRARQQAATEAETKRKQDKAQKETDDAAARTLATQQAGFEKAINRDLSAGKITSAQATVKAMQAARDTALTGMKGQATQELATEQARGAAILKAQRGILAAQRDQAIQAAHDTATASRAEADKTYKGVVPVRVSRQINAVEKAAGVAARGTFDADDATLQEQSAGRIAAAQNKVSEAIRTQRTAYSGIADTLRQSIKDGSLDAEARQKVTKSLNEQAIEAKKLGVYNTAKIEQARASVRALLDEADAEYLVTQRSRGMVSGNDEAADSALALATELDGVGETSGALDVLQSTYDRLSDSLMRGEVSADSVTKLRIALEKLQASMGQKSIEDEFIKTLSGSVDDQMMQLTDKIRAAGSSPQLRAALAKYRDGLAGGLVSAGNPYAAGLIPGANGFQGQGSGRAFLDNISRAVKLTASIGDESGAALETAISRAVEYLASDIGKTLPGSFRDSLQAGIDGARAGLKSLNEVLAKPLDYADARDQTKGLAPIPESPESILAREKKAVDAARQIRDAGDASALTSLEDDHARSLISEQHYLTRKHDLDTVAAYRKSREALEDGKDYYATQAILTADLLALNAKYGQDSLTLSKANAQAARDAQYTSNSVTLKLARDDLDQRHAGQFVTERAFQNLREKQDRDAADASYDAGKMSFEEYQAELTRILRQAVQDRAELDKVGLEAFTQGIQSLGSAFEQLGGSAGLFGKALSTIGTGVQVFGQIQKAAQQTKTAFGPGGSLLDKMGAIGGWAAIAGTVIGAVGSIGDAIMNMNPKLQANKKMWLELASAEQAAMGSKNYGGKSIVNPYYEALRKDSEALTTKANAGFWQRVGWAIFGGAPKTLGKAAAESLTEAGMVFNDFATSLYGSMESALMNAFDSGNFDGVQKAIEKSLNDLVAKMYLQTLIAKSRIGEDLKMLADDQAAGRSITADLARLKDDAAGVTQQFGAGASALPGFGAGAAGDGTSAGGNATLIGAPPAAQFGIPEIKFPDSMLSAFTNVSNMDIPLFNRGSQMMYDGGALMQQAARIIIGGAGGGQTQRSNLF